MNTRTILAALGVALGLAAGPAIAQDEAAVIQGRHEIREAAQDGLGFGVAKTRLIFIFETASSLQEFINQGWAFGANTSLSAMADRQGGMFSGVVSVMPGVYLYQLTDTGLAAQITATGTKFFKDDALN